MESSDDVEDGTAAWSRLIRPTYVSIRPATVGLQRRTCLSTGGLCVAFGAFAIVTIAALRIHHQGHLTSVPPAREQTLARKVAAAEPSLGVGQPWPPDADATPASASATSQFGQAVPVGPPTDAYGGAVSASVGQYPSPSDGVNPVGTLEQSSVSAVSSISATNSVAGGLGADQASGSTPESDLEVYNKLKALAEAGVQATPAAVEGAYAPDNPALTTTTFQSGTVVDPSVWTTFPNMPTQPFSSAAPVEPLTSAAPFLNSAPYSGSDSDSAAISVQPVTYDPGAYTTYFPSTDTSGVVPTTFLVTTMTTTTVTTTSHTTSTSTPRKQLFCFAVMMPKGYERGLLASLLRYGESLFACEEYSVFSDGDIEISPGPPVRIGTTDVGSVNAKYGGKWFLALNSEVFIKIWKKVFSEGKYDKCDWTVKVDPDAVFLPERLRIQVKKEEADDSMYYNNCDQGLHGPIEIISRGGMHSFSNRIDDCVTKLRYEFDEKGEDVFLKHCMGMLKVARVDNFKLLSEDRCFYENPAKEGCTSGKVSFHPFKNTESWFTCLRQARSQERFRNKSHVV